MLPAIVYVLTALAVVDVVLIRRRLVADEHAGHTSASRTIVNVHTAAGAVGLVLWVLFLLAGDDTMLGGAGIGILALGLLWVTAVAGLLLLARWMPTKGRHAETGGSDSWSEGPGLSVLAHLGMLVGVLIFTYAYLARVI